MGSNQRSKSRYRESNTEPHTSISTLNGKPHTGNTIRPALGVSLNDHRTTGSWVGWMVGKLLFRYSKASVYNENWLVTSRAHSLLVTTTAGLAMFAIICSRQWIDYASIALSIWDPREATSYATCPDCCFWSDRYVPIQQINRPANQPAGSPEIDKLQSVCGCFKPEAQIGFDSKLTGYNNIIWDSSTDFTLVDRKIGHHGLIVACGENVN